MRAQPDPEARRARRQALGVALATSVYGVSFGALSVASGLDVWQTCILSLVMFTGGSQFAFVGVIGAGGLAAAPAAIASAALLGVRNVAYGMRMSPVIGRGFFTRAGAAHFTIDESTAVSLAQTTPHARTLGFWLTGLGIYLGWNITTLLGALLGDVLGDPKAYGLDAAAAAAFLALLWPRLRGRQAIAVGVAAAVVATVLTPGLMPGMPVLLAAVVAIVVGWFNWLGRDDESGGSLRQAQGPGPSGPTDPEPVEGSNGPTDPEPVEGSNGRTDPEPVEGSRRRADEWDGLP